MKTALILMILTFFAGTAYATDLNNEQLEEKKAHIQRQQERIMENLQKKYDEGLITKKELKEEVEWHEEELEERIEEIEDAQEVIVEKQKAFAERKKKVDAAARIQLKKRMAEIEAQRKAEAEKAAKAELETTLEESTS